MLSFLKDTTLVLVKGQASWKDWELYTSSQLRNGVEIIHTSLTLLLEQFVKWYIVNANHCDFDKD